MLKLTRNIAACAIAVFWLSLSPAFTAAANGPQIIKLERFRKALWEVTIDVKGKQGKFLFDTGGGVTLLNKNFAKDIDCKFWGRNTGYNMFGKKGEGPHCDNVELSAGGVALTPVNVGIMDFAGHFPGDAEPDGLLSLDAFDGMAITIDQKAATITIETDKSLKKRTRQMTQLPLRVARECSGRCLGVFLGVQTPDGMTWLGLDTGAGGVSLFSREYARSFGLDPEAEKQTIDFTLGPNIAITGSAMVTDMIMDGNLGQPFLSNYVITLDLAHSRAWLAPNR